MVAVGDQRQRHIVGGKHRCELQGMAGRHVQIGQALQYVHRTVRVDRSAHDLVGAAVLDQRPGVDIRLVRIVGRLGEKSLFRKIALLCLGQHRFDQLECKIRRRRKQHETGYAVVARPAQFLHHAQRDPRPHRGADQDLLAFAETPEDGEALGQPSGDRAVGEFAARLAMAGIVVAQIGAALASGPGGKGLRLRAQHVGLVAAEPHHAGRRAGRLPDGDARSVHIDENRSAGGHGLFLSAGLLTQAVVQRKVLAAFLCLVQVKASGQVIFQPACAIDSRPALPT
ncbi:hypothetical protein MPLA_1170076 [Mesorhizobium sp. ORS 3359]|nr:hypothetical protein MPLA_1170076 [Mesorhizobium sp. ORS 3359]